MIEHSTTVTVYKNHRPGVDYFRPVCSCGWYPRGITRSREIADQTAAAHINRYREETTIRERRMGA